MNNQLVTEKEKSKVKEVLSQRESMYSTLVEKSIDGIAIYQDELLKFVNTKFLEITGYSRKELIDKSFIEVLVPPAYKELVTNMYKRRLAGEDVPSHYRAGVQTKDGKDIPVELNISPIEFEGKPAFMAIIRDITERIQSEANLFEQEKLLRTIAENYPNSFVSIIEKDLKVGFSAGQEFEKQNLNPKDFFGLPIEEIFGDQTEFIKQHYLETFKGKETSFELYLNNQYQLFKTVPLIDEKEEIQRILVVAENITERKKAEKALRESEKRFRSVFNQQFQFMALLSPKGRVLEINDLPLQEEGVIREDYIGKFFWETPAWKFNPEWQEKIKSQVFQAMSEEVPLITEDIFQNSDGAIRYADTAYSVIRGEDNKVRFILVQANDITERKVAEQSLSASEERYRRVIEDQSEFIVRWLPNGIRTFVNDSYCRYFGLKREEAEGTSFFSLISEEDRKDVLQRISLLSPQKPVSAGEHQVIRPDGTKGWNLWTDRAFFDEEGKVIEYQSVGRDITEHKEAEEELKIKEDAIESSINAIGIADLDGKVIYVNDACVNLWGYQNKNEILNKYLPEFWYGEGLNKTLEELKEKGFSRGEDTAKSKDGSIFTVQYNRRVFTWQK